MLSWVLCAIAGALLARCLFWHVPQLARMVYSGLRQPARQLPPAAPAPSLVDVLAAQEAAAERRELQLWMESPSAFWLDPTRWERASWPEPPCKADLKYDGSAVDMAVAYVVLTPEERALLTSKRDVRRITSARIFDRYQGRRLQ